MAIPKACFACEHWRLRSYFERDGECRKSAPRPGRFGGRAYWPTTRATEGCGGYKGSADQSELKAAWELFKSRENEAWGIS